MRIYIYMAHMHYCSTQSGTIPPTKDIRGSYICIFLYIVDSKKVGFKILEKIKQQLFHGGL